MLLGRTSLWMLIPPFTHWGTNGLYGEIVVVGFIQDIVKRGTDVRSTCYLPPSATSLYDADLSENTIIVTIDCDGTQYHIPAKYIINLYDGNQSFRYHYLTVKVGLLPISYDMSEAVTSLISSISNATGIIVTESDVYVGISDKGGLTLSDEESVYEDLKRAASISDNDSVLSQLESTQDALTDLNDKYDDLQDTLSDVSGWFS